jgi:hypothetical protein
MYTRTRYLIAGALLAVAAVLWWPAEASSLGSLDKNCSDFKTWQEAQPQ